MAELGQDTMEGRGERRTFLLTWNPKRWSWEALDADLVAVAAGHEPSENTWSTGNTKSIAPGDRLFLLKLGVEPRGLMGSGHATSNVYEAPHWDDARRAAGDTALRVGVRFDRLSAPDEVLSVEELRAGPLGEIHWSPAASGVQVPEHLTTALEEAWSRFMPSSSDRTWPDELVPGVTYVEGAAKTVVVNRYEREPKAREACLKAWGDSCVVCGFSFAQRYGVLGEGYIQVHHLTPVAQLGGATHVDPVRDLRPVCANCHAMLHRGPDLLTPEELEALLA